MNKRLLTQCMALVVAVGAYAYTEGDYIYTKDAKLKVASANLVSNGNFDSADNAGLAGWTSETGGEVGSTWVVTPSAGPNGESVIQSKEASAAEGAALTTAWKLTQGEYAISFKIKSSTGSISITAGSANFASFFANADGSQTVGRQISAALSFAANEWFEVTDTIAVTSAEEFLVFKANNMTEGTQMTNFAIHKVEPVFDTRPFAKRVEFIKKLVADENFNVAAASQLAGRVNQMIQRFEQQDKLNAYDNGLSGMDTQLEASLTAYLDVTSADIAKNDYFDKIEDLTTFAKYNRGSIANGQTISGFKFYGDNWMHSDKADYLTKQIQGAYGNGPGSVVLVNKYMPAGKYYVYAEMRNADCSANYTLTYNLESPVKGFIGTDSIDLGTIVGEDYTPLYFVKELKEGESFEAGFYWDNQDSDGSTFHIKNFQIRSFDKEIGDVVLHNKAWETFLAQWNAAVDARNKLKGMIANTNFPWGQDSLKQAKTVWDPYYTDIINKGWVTADNTDAGIATTDELNEWAKHQGLVLADTTEASSAEEKAFYTNYNQYALVRGYQRAISYVESLNKPFTDLANAIDAAKNERNKGTNATGDREAYKAAILEAINTIQQVRATTTDETREADAQRLADALNKLNAATDAFLASVQGTVVLADIDFSIPVEMTEETTEEGTDKIYTLKGTEGAMVIKNGFDTEDNLGYAVGFGEEVAVANMLRIGNVEAVVDMNGIADGDVVTASFDIHYAQLQNKKYDFAFRNAENEHVAGFSYQVNTNWSLTTNPNELNIDASKIKRAGKSGQTNDALIITGANAPGATHFEIMFDYGKKVITTTMSNVKDSGSPYVSTNTEVLGAEGKNTIISKFVLSSNCNNAARRSWFDNLKIVKQSSHDDFEEDITETPWGEASGIVTVNSTAKAANGAIYTINGVRVANMTQKGLYIVNGKKVIVK